MGAFFRMCLCVVYEAICEYLRIFWGCPACHLPRDVVDQAVSREELVARAREEKKRRVCHVRSRTRRYSGSRKGTAAVKSTQAGVAFPLHEGEIGHVIRALCHRHCYLCHQVNVVLHCTV